MTTVLRKFKQIKSQTMTKNRTQAFLKTSSFTERMDAFD